MTSAACMVLAIENDVFSLALFDMRRPPILAVCLESNLNPCMVKWLSSKWGHNAASTRTSQSKTALNFFDLVLNPLQIGYLCPMYPSHFKQWV